MLQSTKQCSNHTAKHTALSKTTTHNTQIRIVQTHKKKEKKKRLKLKIKRTRGKKKSSYCKTPFHDDALPLLRKQSHIDCKGQWESETADLASVF